jgi:nitrite reductase/ring-hydroxylating ferredoxin subunit
MPLETVGRLEDIPEKEGHLFRSGPHQIALFRLGDSVSAIDNTCPHAGASLANGYTNGEIVACPWHCWEFDCKTGAGLTVEGMDVDTFRVVIEDGMVKVEIPD